MSPVALRHSAMCVISTIILSFIIATTESITLADDAPADKIPIDRAQLPLSFVANVGYDHPELAYHASGMGGTLSFMADRVSFALPSSHNTSHEVQLLFEGANGSPEIVGTDRLRGKVNYFLGDDPTLWRTDVTTYGGVRYQNLYDGIDLVYDGTEGTLKGTYLVAPGIDPAQIGWRYEGAESLTLDPTTGDLQVILPGGDTLVEQAPVAWQIIDGQEVAVPVAFDLTDSGRVRFATGSYNLEYPLVLDPVWVYATFIGAHSSSVGTAVAVDADGYIYLAGRVHPPANENSGGLFWPIINAFQPEHARGCFIGIPNNMCPDAFVMKLSPGADEIIFSTYLGGQGFDYAEDMVIDNASNIYLHGHTTSLDFPTHNAIYPDPDSDAATCSAFTLCVTVTFVTKFDNNGGLIYSTYLGGFATDTPYAVATDAAGNTYVAGITFSVDFPTHNALFPTLNNERDVYLTKIDPTGSSIVFSTFLGGSDNETFVDLAVTDDGTIYVGGHTPSSDFPVTPSTAYQPVFGGLPGSVDAFLTQLDTNGTAITYSTFMGGSGSEWGLEVDVDGNGHVYLAGVPDTGFPVTPGSYDTILDPLGWDIFIAKFDPSQSGSDSLLYSTFLGGTGDDDVRGILALDDGTVFVTGHVDSPNFPLVHDDLVTDYGGYGGYITRFNPDGSDILFSTRFSSAAFSYGLDLATDSQSRVYFAGYARGEFPVTADAFNTGGNGVLFGIIDLTHFTLDYTVDNPTPLEGDTLVYTLTLRNTTDGNKANIIVDADIPAGLTLQSATGDGNYNTSNGQWSLTNLGAGASATLTFTTTVDPGTSETTITNTADLIAFSAPDPYNIFPSTSVDIQVDFVDLALMKTVDFDAPDVGETITYTLALSNDSLTEATGVIVSDLLPATLAFVSASPSQGSYNDVSGEWTAGTVPAGASANLTITATVNPVPLGTWIANVASASANQPDLDPSNNTDQRLVHVPDCLSLDYIRWVSRSHDGSLEEAGIDNMQPPLSLSADGRYLAFTSFVANLVPWDINNAQDVFVYDRQTCLLNLETVTWEGLPPDSGGRYGSLSSDGRYLVLQSDASQLVPLDSNNEQDIFVRDRLTGEVTRVSVASDGTQSETDPAGDGGWSRYPKISGNGRYVVFLSAAPNLSPDDTNGIVEDVFVHDRATHETTWLTIPGAGEGPGLLADWPDINGDGRYIVMRVASPDGDSYELHRYDQLTGSNERIDIGPEGSPFNGVSERADISQDGRYVVFRSSVYNQPSLPWSPNPEIILRDMRTGAISVISRGYGGTMADDDSHYPTISADGQYIMFTSDASNLMETPVLGWYKAYLHDRATGETTLISQSAAGDHANGLVEQTAISLDGNYAAFESRAGNLTPDVYRGEPLANTFLVDLPGTAAPVSYADLDVVMMASGNPVLDDDILTFTVTVTNNGPSTATNVVVTDWLPDDVTLNSATFNGSDCTHDTGVLTCDLGTIAAGSSMNIVIETVVDITVSGTLVNTAETWADEVDANTWNNTTWLEIGAYVRLIAPDTLTATYISETQAVLTWNEINTDETGYLIERSDDGITGWELIETTGADEISYVDNPFLDSCDITYYRVRAFRTADGHFSDYSDPANTVIAPCMPENLHIIAVSPTELQLTWTDRSDTETAYLIERSLDGVSDWDEVVSTDADQETYTDDTAICYYYRIRAYNSGNDGYSDYTEPSIATSTCQYGVDVAIGMSASKPTPLAGEDLIYTLMVSNIGVLDVTATTVTNILPQRVIVEAIAPEICSQTGQTLTCDVGSLASAESQVITVDVSIDLDAGGEKINLATVSISENDPSPGNNTASVLINVIPIDRADVSERELFGHLQAAVEANEDIGFVLPDFVSGGMTLTVITADGTVGEVEIVVPDNGDGFVAIQIISITVDGEEAPADYVETINRELVPILVGGLDALFTQQVGEGRNLESLTITDSGVEAIFSAE